MSDIVSVSTFPLFKNGTGTMTGAMSRSVSTLIGTEHMSSQATMSSGAITATYSQHGLGDEGDLAASSPGDSEANSRTDFDDTLSADRKT